MKLLREAELVDIVERSALDKVERALPPLDDHSSFMEGWLRRGVAEGFFNAAHLCFEGNPVATLIWSQACDPERVLNINAILSHSKDDISAVIQSAVEKLAAAQDCKIIEFHTRRAGMVAKTKQFGWKLHSVVLRKYL